MKMEELLSAISKSGFDSLDEFNGLVCKVDLSTNIVISKYKEWQYKDGTKNGLLKLLGQNNG
jgi:small nuclear ribonucleoprotein (snRNP)-like protein